MIRIALVDDHSLFRRGMKLLLASHPDVEVVADIASGEEFLSVLDEVCPDVVFMDYYMPGLNGAETTEQALMRYPEMKIITLSMFGDNAYYTRMMECGAKGFLLKDSEFDEVIEAGNIALEVINQVLKELDSAENWGTFDLVGGGFFADMFKL